MEKFIYFYKYNWGYIMKKPGKLLSVLVAAFLLVSNLSVVFAQTTDYSKNWANKEINKWLSSGVIQTNEKGDFKPSEPIKRIDMAILLNKLFNYQEKSGTKFSDVAADASFAADVAKAVAAGNFTGNGGKFRPNDSITRQEAAIVFARAFSLTTAGKNVLGKFKDVGKIAAWSKDAVNVMVSTGFMTGVPGSLFAPVDSITRAEAVKIVDNMAKDLKNKAGKYTGDVNGNLVVNTKDVILENMSIKGDLYLSEGIGNGEVALNNVKISGRTIVKGGGENSIVLNNTSVSGSLIIIKKDGKVRVVASGSSEINNITLNSGAKLEESNLTGKGFGSVEVLQIAPGQQVTLDGDFTSLTIDADGVKANIPDGTVGTVKIKEGTSGSKLEIGGAASVKNLVADDDVTVTGGSRIENADINSNGVVLDVKPGSIDIAPNITATVAGTSTTGSNMTAPVTAPATPAAVIVPPVTPPVGGGGSGGGGGGGNGNQGIQTSAGSVSIFPQTATIGGVPLVIAITFVPAEKTNNQTVVFNLPVEIKADLNDKFSTAPGSSTTLSAVNISNSGKTVTLKNLDLTSNSCTLYLFSKTMPVIAKNLTFKVSSDSDGDLSGSLPSPDVSTSLNLVSTISDLKCMITDHSIHASWTPPIGAGVILIHYKKSGISDRSHVQIPRDLTYYDITALESDTVYDVKLQVIGGINDGESNTVSVRTLKIPPALSVDSPANRTGNDITLTFADDGNWRNDIKYLNVFYLDNMSHDTYRKTDLNPSFTVNAGSITIKKDVFKRTGSYSIYVNSAVQYAPSGVILQFGPISNFACTSRTNSKAYFKFYAPAGASSVKIQQSTDSGNNWVDSALEAPITANSTTAASIALASNTEYLFKLVVNGGISEGSSNAERITTYGNIQDFTATVCSNRTAGFYFSAPGNGTSSAVIQLSSDKGMHWWDASGQTAITATTTNASINGLSSDTAYLARVVVTGGVNAGYSNQVGFTTEGNIQDLTITNIEEKSITLRFSPLGEGTSSSVIEYYTLLNPGMKFYYNIPSLCATTTSASIIGLSSDTIYMFRLLTSGGPNYGYSNTMGAKTLITLPITLSASDRTVIAGEITGSRVTVTPIDPFVTLHFSSNNTAIASVDASSGLITGVSAGSAVITVTATKNGYGNASTSFKVTVVDDTVPTIKASVDSLNRITLTFRAAVDKAGTVKVYKADGTSQLGSSIDLAPAAGSLDWESASVVNISNMAGSTGLDNTDAKTIMIKVTGVRDAVTGDVIADKVIMLQAADTKAPSIAANYVAKAGSTAADDTITFYFSEAMDAETLKDLKNYAVTTAAGTTYTELKALSEYSDVSISSVASDNMSIVIKVKGGKAAADAGLAFEVSAMKDTAGNMMAATKVSLNNVEAPYVVTATAIAVNKIEIVFNQQIKSSLPGTFILRTGDSSTSPVAAVIISTLIDSASTKVTLTLDRDMKTDVSGAYLDILDKTKTKNYFDIEMTSGTGLILTKPVALVDRIKATVKDITATAGGIIIEFSELVTTTDSNFVDQELYLTQGSDVITVNATSVSAITAGESFTTGFKKLMITGLTANKEYLITLTPHGVTRDVSPLYHNWFVKPDGKYVTVNK
jgi:hypothetical protein